MMVRICDRCKTAITSEQLEVVNFLGNNYDLCGSCAMKYYEYMITNMTKFMKH